MKEYELFYKLRHKQDKTQAEELLLKYRNILGIISEILVDESKWNISETTAITKIRDYLSKNF